MDSANLKLVSSHLDCQRHNQRLIRIDHELSQDVFSPCLGVFEQVDMHIEPKWGKYSEDSFWTLLHEKTLASGRRLDPNSSIEEAFVPWYSPSHQCTQIPLAKPSISTSFPDLPLELRLHIWQLTLPRPRVVHLNHQAFTQSNNISHSETNPERLYFLTCKEFSQVFSSNYTKILVSQTDGSSNHRRAAFVDYRRDTISLCLDSFRAFAVDKSCLDISRIHNLALSYCTALASYQECIWTVLERLCP
ncbi:hypothetical protein B0J14DRAFT_278743 [Halenospora varia]|nr:hypothetical protein B0J14DRAFT_278743 [Halenospora varia]